MFRLLLSIVVVFRLIIAAPYRRTPADEAFLLQEAGKMLFQLHTRENAVDPWEFELNDLDYLSFSPLNTSLPTKILVHGWGGYFQSDFIVWIHHAYLIQNNVNVIIVSWDLNADQSYFSAKSYVPTAGRVVALMIDLLCQNVGLNLKDLHVVGHSLGAHVAGIAGRHTTVGKLPRITGLDPAGPFYFWKTDMISSDSANFVDIVHTSRGMAGTLFTLGHVDFYPNGGYPFQPGCGFDFTSLRSHGRSASYFAEAIMTPGGFMAVKCEDWTSFKAGNCQWDDVAEMGERVSTSLRGNYYLRTNLKTPFALGNLSLHYAT